MSRFKLFQYNSYQLQDYKNTILMSELYCAVHEVLMEKDEGDEGTIIIF